MRRALLALAALLAAVPAPARAQALQEALYAPVPPPGSAFLRFVNTLAAPVEVQPGFLAARQLGTAGEARATPFLVVEAVAGRALRVTAQGGGRAGREVLHAAPGNVLTVLVHPSAAGGLAFATVIEDAEFNRTRTRLAFYNALPGCGSATLRLAGGGTSVLGGVPPFAGRARSVPPAAAELEATCAGRPAASLRLAGLAAGAAFSVFLRAGADGAPTLFVLRDGTAPP